ncbi:hypothetical protein C8F04DRAFT_1085451 [Mycena alexandri]|uniref:Zinc finger PHD-type domain-containing protein n=1 Tax=Mycena alexandri TaxID=1745969 RepID=A0AAD6WQT2_9AGAR|nr:hypothetical protein C8F04DRAFT_1155662 [Mycena alexandri]KAJ7039487.1 hypothetical protein C8F04DRAFT_1085451 [Mycena alexandri]
MPRRAAPPPADLVDPDPDQLDPASSAPDPVDLNLARLRTHWKWAAFSQFFYTFSHLFAMEDVSLTDIEDDLVRESNIFLPRVMARLLFILSYDRKVSLDNWQSALRKQHKRRDPASNPIGPEPHTGTPEPRYRYESVSVDDPTTTPDDADAEPREGAANGDGDFAVSDKVGSALPSGSRANTEEKTTPAPEVLPQVEEEEPEESRDWLDLPMLAKLDSMHLLTEWQFQNATRLRTMMKSDDEDATWRIEPIGYDAKSNAYWLIGADRLWIQRALPKPPKYTATTSSLKRKRPEIKTSTTKFKRPAAKRARLASEDPKLTITVTVSGGRAAKAQAKLKLDAQAKELAELNRAAGTRTPATRTSHGGRNPVAAVRPLGTRVSARLRTGADEDEWQAVPQDWLADEGSKKKAPVKPRPKTGLESDDDSVSDLTELSEEDPEEAMKEPDGDEVEEDAEASVKADAEETDPAPDAPEATLVENNREEEQPDGFVEWETICVTLSDWEHIAERFENGTHYAEKALYKVLVKDIVPIITEELREIERKRRLEEAVVHRKRSSRIANKESEKEEARQLARQKAEVVEKKNRAQRLEARLAKEEAERERREAAREQRRKAKEEQEQEGESAPDEESTDMQVDVVGGIDLSPVHLSQNTYLAPDTRRRNGNAAASTPTSGTRTPMGDDWVLNCEICQRSGMNLDDGMPLVCCGLCSQWSHVSCHDRADAKAGRPQRNWDQVEFICRQCQTQRMAVKTFRQYPPQQQQQHRASIPSPYTSQTTPIAQSMPYSQYGHGPPPQPQPAAHPPRNYPGAYPVAVNGVSRYAQQPTIALAPSQQQMPYPTSSVNYRPQQSAPPPPRISAGPSIPHQHQVASNHQHQHHNTPNHQHHHQQQSQSQHLGAANNQHEQQHYPATYERSPAQFQHIAPNVNGHRAPVYPQQRPVTQGWNVPPAHYAASNGVPRRDGERHQYGDGAQWHGGGSQQAAAYGYHNGQ